MALKEELHSTVKEIFATKWATRVGTVVPEAENLTLGNDGVTLEEAVVLYADMAGSTKLVQDYKDWFAAEVYKAFLHCASKIIREYGGSITAFDGDRVMAVFIGDYKCTSAAKSALKIKGAVKEIINPAMASFQTPYTLNHGVGIDMSKLFVARTGIRGSNDLVWVGRAANFAAKLCNIREESYNTYITKDVYEKLAEEAKFGGDQKENMWEKRAWAAMNGIDIYRSSWHWSL